eukprot:1138099-Pelagomonas_calceolata.AAC.1
MRFKCQAKDGDLELDRHLCCPSYVYIKTKSSAAKAPVTLAGSSPLIRRGGRIRDQGSGSPYEKNPS